VFTNFTSSNDFATSVTLLLKILKPFVGLVEESKKCRQSHADGVVTLMHCKNGLVRQAQEYKIYKTMFRASRFFGHSKSCSYA